MRIHEPWLGSSQSSYGDPKVVIKPSKLPLKMAPPKRTKAKRIKKLGGWGGESDHLSTTTGKKRPGLTRQNLQSGWRVAHLWPTGPKTHQWFGTFGSKGLRTRIFPQEKLHQILGNKNFPLPPPTPVALRKKDGFLGVFRKNRGTKKKTWFLRVFRKNREEPEIRGPISLS